MEQMTTLRERITASVFARRMTQRVVAKDNGDDSFSVVVCDPGETPMLIGTVWCQSRGVWAYAIEGVASAGGWSNTANTKRDAVRVVHEAFARGKCPNPQNYRRRKVKP